MTTLFILSQTGGSQNIIMFIAVIMVFFFFMVLPQIRRQKKEKTFQKLLKKGDRIVTTSGMHGKILELSDSTCVIETMAGKIKFNRSAISMETSQQYKPTTK